jgi:hypothetical protein
MKGGLTMPHPFDTVKSIERAMAREQTRDQHPKCGFERCARPAEFTLEMGTASGSGYDDLCKEHLTKKLESPIFAAKVLTALIEERLPKVEPKQKQETKRV